MKIKILKKALKNSRMIIYQLIDKITAEKEKEVLQL